MAYPYGTYDDRVLKILKRCGIKYARTIQNTPDFTPQEDLLQLKASCCFTNPNLDAIIDRFIESESDEKQVLYIWGHSFEFDKSPNGWQEFEDALIVLTGTKDLVFCTNAQVIELVEKYQTLKR